MAKSKISQNIKALWMHENVLHILTSEKVSHQDITILQKRHKAGQVKVLLIEQFLKEVMEYNTKLLVSIRDGRVIFDRLDMVKVIGLNIQKGLMAGTKEMLLKKFMSIQKELKEMESSKSQAFENIYISCLEAAQAALLSKGRVILIPKMVPEMLRVFLLGKGLERTQIKYCEEIIWTYKALEHKKIQPLTGKEIDKLAKKTELFRDAVKRIS